MKKFFATAVLALMGLTASAQQTIALSTYQGTDISKFEGKTVNVSATRYMFNGWNTISLPFAVSPAQIDDLFGSDCQLEMLVGVEKTSAGEYRLNFQNCKANGIQPNTPYILNYKGESGNKKIVGENVQLVNAPAQLTYTVQGTDVTATMGCAQTRLGAEGLYGILAADNSEAKFVNVGTLITNGFYATRCYVKLSDGTSAILSTNHIDGDATAITNVLKSNQTADVYNFSGVKVASQLNASQINQLQRGIYVVNGKKVMVK